MTVDQVKFKKGLLYAATARASELRAAIASFEQLDKHSEKIEHRWLIACWVTGIIAFFTFGAGLVFFIPCYLMKRRYTRLNTEDRRYGLIGELVPLLETDMADDALFEVSLNLGKPDAKANFVSKGKAGHWNVAYYRDDWLTLRGRFVDGTAFCVQASELHQARSRWARSRSGKSKYKVKTKSATEFMVRLKPKQKRYAHLSELGQNAEAAIQLPGSLDCKALSVADGGLQLKTKCKGPWDARISGRPEGPSGTRMVSLMMLSLYQVLNLSRRMTKKAG